MVDTSAPPVLQFEKVSKWYGKRGTDQCVHVLDEIDFKVPKDEEGEILAILGPSGSGKSTVLCLISGLQAPDVGSVTVNGTQVEMPNPQSVTVPQAYTCFPWLTVRGNVEFGLRVQGRPAAERKEIAMDYLQKVGLGDRAESFPRELSGGMQQRVAIARALAMKLPIVLMDEPFGALDPQIRSEMQEMLLQLWAAERNLIIFVTHDITEAVYLADRVLVFSARPAKIILDVKVTFPRPRLAGVRDELEFGTICNYLLSALKKAPSAGQVRVSI